jgi:hypothetical protein
MEDKRTIAWFSAFVAVVLLAGVATGILVDRFLLRPPQDRGFGRAGGPLSQAGPGGRMGQGMGFGAVPADGMRGGGRGLGPGPGALADRLERELSLTAAQKAKVVALLEQRRSKLDGIRTEMAGRMQKEQADLRGEIRALLDPAQQKRFDEVVATSPGLGTMPPGGPGGPGGRGGRGR